MRSRSYEIALCGIAAAAGVLFLAIACYVPVGRLGMMACATVALFLPFSMGMWAGGILAYAAICALTFFIGGGNGPVVAAAYALFFGLHPLLIYLLFRFRAGLVLRLVIAALFAALEIFLLWKFVGILELLAIDVPLWMLEAVGVPVFLGYEYLMERVYLQIGRLCDRFGRRR